DLQRQVADIIGKDPNVDAAMSFVGATGFSPSLNRGRITITLKPFKQRKPADQVVRELRPKLANVMGAKIFLQNVPAIRIGGQLTQSPYQYVMRSANIEELYQWAPVIEQKLKTLPELVDISSDLQITRPEVTVEIEREKASALGVSAQSIEMALNNAYGARQVSTIYTATNQFWVILELQVPATLTGTFSGTAQAYQSSLQGMGILLLLSIVVIYLVLGILYESFIHPLTILSGLPTAGLGALLTLMAFGIELNMYAFVGIIMLVGIVKKNAIMMIDFAIEAQRKGGLPPEQAIYQAGLIRFRP